MTQEEINALLAKVGEEAKGKIEAFKSEFKNIVESVEKGTVKKEDVDKQLSDLTEKINSELPENIQKLVAKQFDEINEVVKSQGAEITALKEKGTKQNDGRPLRISEMLKNELIEQGIAVKNEAASEKYGRDVYMIKDSKSTRKGIAKMQSKSAIDMTTALTFVPGTNTSIGYLTDYVAKDVLLNQSNDTHMLDVLPVTPVNDKYFGVVVENTEVDGTATTDENSGAGKSSFKLSTIEYKVFKINTYYHVSEEQLEDVDQLMSKIERRGINNLKSKIDTKILGTTGDNSTDIRGMYATSGTTYTAFDNTITDTVKDASIIDLIDKMKLQAIKSDDEVNAVILHPSDISRIETEKDADGNSLNNRSVVYDKMGNLISIKGLAVIRNKKQTANTTCVMWSEAAEIGLRRDVEMVIGLDSDDLTTGMRTVVLSVRLAFGPSKPSAIIYSDNISDDVAAITTV